MRRIATASGQNRHITILFKFFFFRFEFQYLFILTNGNYIVCDCYGRLILCSNGPFREKYEIKINKKIQLTFFVNIKNLNALW